MIDKAIIKTIALTFYITAFSFWPLLWVHSFYHLLAGAISLHWFAGLLPVRYIKLNDKITWIGILCALNNILDEIFFDPTSFDVNEYIFLSIILLTVICGKRIQKV